MSAMQILDSLNLTVEESEALAKVKQAIAMAEAALDSAAQELQQTWGQDEGDDPEILDALAAIRSLN